MCFVLGFKGCFNTFPDNIIIQRNLCMKHNFSSITRSLIANQAMLCQCAEGKGKCESMVA